MGLRGFKISKSNSPALNMAFLPMYSFIESHACDEGNTLCSWKCCQSETLKSVTGATFNLEVYSSTDNVLSCRIFLSRSFLFIYLFYSPR